MRRATLLYGICPVVVCLGLLAGCASSGKGASPAGTTAPTSSNTHLIIAHSVVPGVSADPAQFTSPDEWTVDSALYDTLFGLNKKDKVIPEVGTSYKFSSNGMQLTVTMRSDVVFHDGSKVTARAVKATIDRAKAIGSPQTQQLLEPIVSVDVVNATTVRFNLNRPGADIPSVLAQPATGIINPKAISEKLDLSTGDHDIAGSGPYVIGPGGFKSDISADLVPARTPYWDKTVTRFKEITLERIPDPNTRLNALEGGQVNAIADVPETLFSAAEAVSQNNFYKIPTGQVLALYMRDTNAPLNNLKVRQAIEMAVDRNAIAQQELSGACQSSFQDFLPGAPGYSSTLKDEYPYDVAKAKQLLAEAGYANGFTLNMIGSSAFQPEYDISTIIQSELAQIGIKVNISSEATNQTFLDFNAGKYDLYVTVVVEEPTPMGLYERAFLPDGPSHLASGSAGQQLTKLVNSAYNPKLQGGALDKVWQSAAKVVMDNAWHVPLCFAQTGLSFPKSITGVDNGGFAEQGNVYDVRDFH